MSGRCLEVVSKVSESCLKVRRCLEGFWKMSGSFLNVVSKVFGMCLEIVWRVCKVSER